MLRIVLLSMTLAAVATPAGAADVQPSPPPEVQALGRMAQECQGREASALVQTYALQARLAEAQARLAAETKRADDAEAKLKPAEPSEASKP